MNITININTDESGTKVSVNGNEVKESGSLKRCPFCGSEAVRKIYNNKYYIECEQCFAQSDFFETEKEAAEKWNRRV